MISLDIFEDMVGELSQTIPEQYYVELNGGVIVQEEIKLHPKSRHDDLVIMGEYHKDYNLGRYVVIYYGSFLKIYGDNSVEIWKKNILRVLKHELTHHLESRAGERDLEIEDAIEIAHYIADSSKADSIKAI